MTVLDFDDLIDLLDEGARELRRAASFYEFLDGADVAVEGHATDRIVAKFHLNGRSLYVLVSPRFLENDYRLVVVEEETPLDDGTIRQLWDSGTEEYILEKFRERGVSDGT